MTKLKNILILFVMGIVVFMSCDNNAPKVDNSKDKAQELENAKVVFRQDQQKIAVEIDEMLVDINKTISDLQTKMTNASAEGKSDINDQIAKLNASAVELGEQMRKIKMSSRAAWGSTKSDVANILKEMKADWKDVMNSK